jgi:23S rRNA (uracil1939-C5)-methyltransferase
VSDHLELTIERPVAGGRMIARHEGRVVFVAGGIPGERVSARIERRSRQSIWATVTEVHEASPDRREPVCDPACGGSTFAHIQYERQRALKQQILVDAFRRLARLTVGPPAVAASPEQGYRLRARFHTDGTRLGFYREGTHTICEAASTGQLRPEATTAAQALFDALGLRRADCAGVTVSENVAGTGRVVHLEPRERARLDDVADLIAAVTTGGELSVSGVTTLVRGAVRTIVGEDAVQDDDMALWGAGSAFGGRVRWRRRAPVFFQANRFLIGALVQQVLDAVVDETVADLYSGVGLFAVALAARGARVSAIEGEPLAAEDLDANAAPYDRLTVVHARVEDAVRRPPVDTVGTAVLDPPRSGASPEALAGLIRWRPRRIVYVSCDPPTLARDAARLVTAGYHLDGLHAFDLFPNTPHVEAVTVFDLRARGGPSLENT